MITYFVPIYNEANKNFIIFLKILEKRIKIKNHHRYILVNDGSTDDTQKLLKLFLNKNREFIKNNKVVIIKNDTNMGVGYSFRKALKVCKTKYIMPLPSDNDLPLVNPAFLQKNDVDYVIFFPLNAEKYSIARYILSIVFRLIYCTIFNLRVIYIQGSFIAKKSVIKKIKLFSNRFTFWPELNVKMLRSNISFIEFPLIFRNKSVVDRTVSIQNLFEILKNLLMLILVIYVLDRRKYKKFAKKKYPKNFAII